MKSDGGTAKLDLGNLHCKLYSSDTKYCLDRKIAKVWNGISVDSIEICSFSLRHQGPIFHHIGLPFYNYFSSFSRPQWYLASRDLIKIPSFYPFLPCLRHNRARKSRRWCKGCMKLCGQWEPKMSKRKISFPFGFWGVCPFFHAQRHLSPEGQLRARDSRLLKGRTDWIAFENVSTRACRFVSLFCYSENVNVP